jgi:hypothetical protein
VPASAYEVNKNITVVGCIEQRHRVPMTTSLLTSSVESSAKKQCWATMTALVTM